MDIQQKMFIGASLTVNIWLIVVALVRVTLFRSGKTVDIIWILFFQFIEPNLAILAACISAFRSLLVRHSPHQHAKRGRPTHSLQQRVFKMTRRHHRQLDDLASVPGATSIGTMTWQNDGTRMTDFDSNDSPLKITIDENRGDVAYEPKANDDCQEIMVNHELSVISNRVSGTSSSEVVICMF